MFLLGMVIGVLIGVAITAAAFLLYSRSKVPQADQLRDTFAAAAAEALDANSRRLTELAGASLESKKQLIDQSVAAVGERLEKVRTVLQQIEGERQKHYGELAERLAALAGTTETLRQALAGSKRVGAWGERMTEDVLRMVGMIDGVNYRKQSAEAAESGKPDFTFLLPNELSVNMDVKFPLDKALDYLNAETDEQRAARGGQFVAAVRGHVRTVARRGYIDTAGGTVDYVIVFIPNEQVYALALELEPTLMDEALGQRVVLCGPLTLYAVLMVIRQAAENANITKTADEVLALLAVFEKQWQRYREAVDLVGKRLDSTRQAYDDLTGTRTRQLEKPLARIEELRSARGLPEADASDESD